MIEEHSSICCVVNHLEGGDGVSSSAASSNRPKTLIRFLMSSLLIRPKAAHRIATAKSIDEIVSQVNAGTCRQNPHGSIRLSRRFLERHLFPLGLALMDSSLLVTQEFALKTRSGLRNFAFAD